MLPIPPQLNFTSLSDSDKVRNPSQIGSILPDGTVVLPKPPPQLNFIPPSDSDKMSFPSSQTTFDDNDSMETSDLDSFLSSVSTNTQKWNLLSGKSVKEIYSVNISQYAEVLKKRKY